MLDSIKRYIFKKISFDDYLRLHQRGFFTLYKSSILRFFHSYDYHYQVKKLISKGDVIIDIGANLGYYSFLFSHWTGKLGKVYSVEPIQTYNKIFNEIAHKYDNVVLYPYALGLEEKQVNLVSSSYNGYFRTGLPHVYDVDRDGNIDNIDYIFESHMKIPSKLFGDLKRIDYIKCDIEGFEYTVISEMKNLISKNRPIVQVEVWEKNEKLMRELFDSIEYKAYKVKGGNFIPLNNSNLKIEGDYIFVSKDRLKKYGLSI